MSEGSPPPFGSPDELTPASGEPMPPPTGPPLASPGPPPGGPYGSPPTGPPLASPGPPPGGPYGSPPQGPYGPPAGPYGQYGPPAGPYGQPPGSPYGGYAAPAAPSSATNGLAVAALVLGCLTFLCLGPIGAIPAIVLGILGLRAARQSGVGRGMSIAGLVLGGVGLLMWILVIVLIVVAGSRAGSALKNLGGPADPASYQIHPGACSVDGVGQTVFTGTITNETSSTKNFSVDAEFRDPASGLVLDTSSTVVSAIAAGDTVRWQITATDTQTPSGDRVTCRVSSVDNFFN